MSESKKLASEANQRWLANLTPRRYGITDYRVIEPGVIVYSGRGDREYTRSSHLAMRLRDPNYPEIAKSARKAAKAEERRWLREMADRGMISPDMAPPDDPRRTEAA